MAELKKCPFCGGEAKFTYSVNGSHMHIHCEDTNCIGSTIMNDYETEAEAIEAWNNRATESEIRAKAIDEFAEKLKWEYENSIGISQREIDFANAVTDQVAEQLKEE
jgi:Lar family restriction alleviation protein